jgi:hypothetical protein
MADQAIQINAQKQPTDPAPAGQNACYFVDRTLASVHKYLRLVNLCDELGRCDRRFRGPGRGGSPRRPCRTEPPAKNRPARRFGPTNTAFRISLLFSSFRHQFLESCALLFCVPFVLASCNNDKIEVYRIPKENPIVAMEEERPAPQAPELSAKWTKPDSWSEQPVSEMRLASFKVNGTDATSADVSVTAFPGDAGGLVSNVNRWRGQLELPQLEENRLRQTIQQREIQGAPAYFVDLQTVEHSSKPSRILGAVMERPDRTWFVKMTGPPALLESQRQKFFDFVTSFQFENSDQSGVPASPTKQKSTNDK